jgi:O-antigen/teichoic acid export membrane protein
MSLSISLLPLFSKYFSYNKKQLKIKFSVIFREFLILSAFLTVVLLPKSGFILSILYPQEYLNGEKVFQVLSVTIPLYFANIILGNLLIAIKKEKIQILSMIIGATVKLLILFFFIPIFGIVGAAITCLISDLLMLVIQYIAVKTAGYIHIIGKTDLVKISIIIMSLTINFLIQNIWIMILILPVFFIFIIDTFRTIKLKI